MEKLEKLKQRYRFSIVESESHETLKVFNLSRFHISLLIVAVVIVLFFFSYALIAFTPIRSLIPGYPDAYSKQKALENAVKVDSLESAMARWELYSSNIARVLAGEATVTLDSLVDDVPNDYLMQISEEEAARQDSLLRKMIDEENQFNLSQAVGDVDMPIEGRHFYMPVKGAILNTFNATHQAVDIAAPEGSIVFSVMEGSVVYSGWDDAGGYTIVIQHPSDLISIYTGNRNLLKRAGEVVNAGTPIAFVGNKVSLSSESHLHFELWYKGERVDPATYIDFK